MPWAAPKMAVSDWNPGAIQKKHRAANSPSSNQLARLIHGHSGPGIGVRRGDASAAFTARDVRGAVEIGRARFGRLAIGRARGTPEDRGNEGTAAQFARSLGARATPGFGHAAPSEGRPAPKPGGSEAPPAPSEALGPRR